MAKYHTTPPQLLFFHHNEKEQVEKSWHKMANLVLQTETNMKTEITVLRFSRKQKTSIHDANFKGVN